MFNIKKRYFTRELKRTKADIWSTEFTIFATRKEIEATRAKLEKTKSVVFKIEQQMEADPKNVNLAKEGQGFQRQVEVLEDNMRTLTEILQGKEANVDEPYQEPVMGMLESLENKKIKKVRLEDFIKSEC